MEKEVTDLEKTNTTIDLIKFLMAILVVGIHTQPFGFNIWLDRGFGIVTRLCVPYFFVASSYFFWIKPKNAELYIKRILKLYFIWSVIYLPFDLGLLRTMPVQNILERYLWSGNDHALWYLWGSVIGFLIVLSLSKFMSGKKVFLISVLFLIIGCMKSTWSPLLHSFTSFEIRDRLGSVNGLFYAFPYIALGMVIAGNQTNRKDEKISKYVLGLFLSFISLSLESLLFILYFHTASTVLWISVLPCTYYLFMLSKNIYISFVSEKTALMLRKMSTLIYVGHSLFLILFKHLDTWKLFIAVVISSLVLAAVIIKLSGKKHFGWMKLLY